MPLTHCREDLRKQHRQLSHLAVRLEKTLESASKNDFAEHLKGFHGLQSLGLEFAGIVRHCQIEDEAIELVYRHSLQPQERLRIGIEHDQIIRAVENVEEELKCATADRTMALIVPGMDLVNRLRAHIAYERELLGRLTEARISPARSGGKTKNAKPMRKHRRHIAKPKLDTKGDGVLPYTVELHPEL
jgi:hypothetical protein